MTDEFEKYLVQEAPDEYERYRSQEEPSSETKGFKGVAEDAFHAALRGVLGLPSALMQIPVEGYGAARQLVGNPGRVAQNIGGGFGSLGHGILSAPANIRDYLARKELVSSDAPSLRLPENILPKEYNYPEALGREGQEIGDVLLEGIPAGIALSPIGKGAEALTAKIPSVTSKGLANKILSNKFSAKEAFKQKYGDLFKNAEKAGIRKVEKPKININVIEKNTVPKYHKALLEFNKNPTLENAHLAQSDLGKMVRAFEKSLTPLASPQIKALKEAVEAQNKIKHSMFNKSPELAKKYSETTHGYAKEVVPYTSNKNIGKFQRGELTAQKLMQRLKNDDAFMIAVGKKYPGIKINQLMQGKTAKLILKGLGLGAGVGVGSAAYKAHD